MKKYAFHTDPGHGWLAVPVADLTPEQQKWISDCSYYDARAGIVYLEEDCDAQLVPRPHQIVEVDHPNDAPCRGLPRWPAQMTHAQRMNRLYGMQA